MKFNARLPRLSIGGLLAQIAIIAYLFFAIATECRDIELTPWELCKHYLSDWRLRDRGGIVNLLCFIDIPIALNALTSIKQYRKKMLEDTGVFFSIFHLYNFVLLIRTLVYCLWISSREIVFQGLHLANGAVLLVLAVPMFLALLVHTVRQIMHGEFAIDLLAVSTTLIVLMELGYLASSFLYPYS